MVELNKVRMLLMAKSVSHIRRPFIEIPGLSAGEGQIDGYYCLPAVLLPRNQR
jgi:hypothetical protein